MSSEVHDGDYRHEVEGKGKIVSKTTGEILTDWGQSTGKELHHGQARPKPSSN